MARETRPVFRKSWKYPLFLAGLIVLVVGELVAHSAGATPNDEAAIGALGLAVIVCSIALG